MHETRLRNSALIWAGIGAACLLGVGLGFDWTAAVVIVVVGTLLWLGYQLAGAKLSVDQRRVHQERTALDAEWAAQDRARQIRDAFWDARIAMREEAQRYWPIEGPGRGGNR